MKVRTLLLALALVGGAAPVGAQTDDDDNAPFYRPSSPVLSLDFEAGGVFDTNINQNDAEIHSQGFVARGIFEAQKRARSRVFRLRYIGDVQSYTESDRWDRTSSNVTAMFYQNITRKLTFTGIGGYSLRGPAEEQLPANQYSGWSQLRYRVGPAAEIGFYGAYRWVRPQDERFEENVLAAGIELGGDIGRRSVWEIGYQREQSDSPTPARRYRTDRFRAEYALTLGRRASLGIRLEHTKRLFPEAMFRLGEIAVPREEQRWLPSAFWYHRFGSGNWLTVRWGFQERTTNYGRGAWKGQRLDASLRIPLVARHRTRGPQDPGFPLPPLPDGVPSPDPPILEQLRYLSAKAEVSPKAAAPVENGLTFTRGSNWKEVLAVHGVPTRVSERPLFFEDLWYYEASWVTFKNGRVVSWHDAGNLKLRPEPREKKRPGLESQERNNPGQRQAGPTAVMEALPQGLLKIEDNDESITSAFVRVAEPEIVLTDGTRLKGVLRKCEKGLAHVLLFLENGRTLLATMPEQLIDKRATNPLPALSSDKGKN